MSDHKQQRYTVDEYLRFEESSPLRHEYVQGQIFAMTGGTNAHEIIAGNAFALLHSFTRDSSCRAYIGNMKLHVQVADSIYYPDVTVSCEQLEPTSILVMSPRLIIEVISRSTRSIDAREKRIAYQKLASLQQYVMLYQNRIKAEVYTRVAGDDWLVATLHATDKLSLAALPNKQLHVPLVDVYDGLTFPPVVTEDEEEYAY